MNRLILDFIWTIALLHHHIVAAGLAPTGTSSEYASRCNAAKQKWIASGGQTFESETTFKSTYSGSAPSTCITTETFLSSDSTPYTLCDGYPRINGSRTISTITVTTPFTSTIETSSSVYRNISQPTCTIQPSDCARLHQIYTSDLSKYSRSSEDVPYPTSPICGSATLPLQTSAVGAPACAMQEASVRLLYWPVSQAKSCDPCHRPDCPTTTLGPTITGKPNTFTTLNTTLTSPTVYIEFEGSWAYISLGTTFSSPQTLIVAQKADAVSSYCGKPGGGYGPPRKVDYANFNYPVPADVYRCQPSCFVEPMPFTYANLTHTYTYSLATTTKIETVVQQSYISEAPSNLCSTIWNDYAPVLSIPNAFKTIQPAGFQGPGSLYGDDNPCQFIFNEEAVLFDPPLALTKQSREAKPTLPPANSAYPTSEQAESAATPVRTSEPQVTAIPESLGLTVPAQEPAATVYTDPNSGSSPSAGAGEDAGSNSGGNMGSSQAIGNIIASALGMTSKDQGQGGSNAQLTLAIASDGSAIVVNGVTSSLPAQQAPQMTGSAEIGNVNLGGNNVPYTKRGSQVIIEGQTLNPGVTATVDGHTLSLASDSQVVVVSGDSSSTMNLHPTATTILHGSDDANMQTGAVTVDGKTVGYTDSGSVLVIGDQTLSRGHSVVVSGESQTTQTTHRQGSVSRTHAAAGPSSTTSDASVLSLGWYGLLAMMASLILPGVL